VAVGSGDAVLRTALARVHLNRAALIATADPWARRGEGGAQASSGDALAEPRPRGERGHYRDGCGDQTEELRGAWFHPGTRTPEQAALRIDVGWLTGGAAERFPGRAGVSLCSLPHHGRGAHG
jgi:hypothetical protein